MSIPQLKIELIDICLRFQANDLQWVQISSHKNKEASNTRQHTIVALTVSNVSKFDLLHIRRL